MATDNKKKRTYASNAVLYAVFVIGAIVVVNLLGTRVFGRLDLTESKVYTLSPSSRDLVKKLPDYMQVKAFISGDLPPELKATSRYVRDLIGEYATSSNKFRWEVIDPKQDKKLEEEAGRCKVQPLQIQRIGGQKFEVGTYYMGVCLEYGGQTEALPQIARPEGLEYQMSSLIKRMTQKKKKIAFTTGHGESDTNQGFQALKGDLEQEFEVTTVNPSSAEIGADVDALVVGGPKQALDEKAQKEIDKFLMKGKGAVFLVDGMAMSSPQGMPPGMGVKMAQGNESGLTKVLETYGFKVNQDFVFVRPEQAMPGPVDTGDGRMMLANAPWFVPGEAPEAKDLTVLEGIRGAIYPFASSVDLVGPLAGGKTPNGSKLWKLGATSKDAWQHTGFFVLSAKPDIKEGTDKKSFTLGYAYQGPLKSAFGAPAMESSADKTKAPSETAKARVIIIGDSDFANDQYMQLARFLPVYGAGAQLLFNAISWTVEDEALTPLRSKGMNPRPIKVESEATATVIQWANIVGLPVAFCLFGLVRWRIRRSARHGLKL